MPLEILLEPITISLSILSGIAVGFSLGLVGGGGSLLAVPLLLYVVGIKDTHAAIGTSALAIAIIATISIFSHKKKGNLQIKKGILFTMPGIVGTLLGSQLGLWTSAENLLILFAAFIAITGIFMIKNKTTDGNNVTNSKSQLILLKKNILLSGFSVGILAGFFGIGGGFLIVPAMMYSGGLNIVHAIGTSLVSVSSFGFVTAGRYFVEDHVDFVIVMLLVAGGLFGSYLGIRTAEKIPKKNLSKIFSILLFGVAAYIIVQTILM